MKELPVEDHIRGVVKDLLRTRGIAHHGLETDINGAKQIPWKGLKYRLSLQVGCLPHIFTVYPLKRGGQTHNLTFMIIRWITGIYTL